MGWGHLSRESGRTPPLGPEGAVAVVLAWPRAGGQAEVRCFTLSRIHSRNGVLPASTGNIRISGIS